MQGGRRLEHAIGGWGGWASWPDRYSAGNQSYGELLVAPDHEAVGHCCVERDGAARDRVAVSFRIQTVLASSVNAAATRRRG
jgi:hypothetical protein